MEELDKNGFDASDYLIQVIPAGRPKLHDRGKIVFLPTVVGAPIDPREWLEPQSYADAVICIGGDGGTLSSWLGALHAGLPRFPLLNTGGDAEKAFNRTVDLWDMIPVPGITREDFKSILGGDIKDSDTAKALAGSLVGTLLRSSLFALDQHSRLFSSDNIPSLFISYSRKDVKWVERLRTLMRPYERKGAIATWMDVDIEPGSDWAADIDKKLTSARAAFCVVTEHFLDSTYVKEKEMFMIKQKLSSEASFRLFWALFEPCEWRSWAELEEKQAADGVTDHAVSQCTTESDVQIRLFGMVDNIIRTMARQNA